MTHYFKMYLYAYELMHFVREVAKNKIQKIAHITALNLILQLFSSVACIRMYSWQ